MDNLPSTRRMLMDRARRYLLEQIETDPRQRPDDSPPRLTLQALEKIGMSRSRERILANLDEMYKEAFDRAKVTGDDSQSLSEKLAGQVGIDMVAPFGTSLHVSGRDQAALEATIAPWRDKPGLHWQKGVPSLEDVFIELMGRSKDNFQ